MNGEPLPGIRESVPKGNRRIGIVIALLVVIAILVCYIWLSAKPEAVITTSSEVAQQTQNITNQLQGIADALKNISRSI